MILRWPKLALAGLVVFSSASFWSRCPINSYGFSAMDFSGTGYLR